MQNHTGGPKIFTVSEINREISSLLSSSFQFVRVAGEISNLKIPFSGHHYFSLKDSKNQIRAVLFKNQKKYLSQQLTDGQQVVCDGRIAVYEPRGEYQLIVDTIDFHGLGSLQVTFEQLKSRLRAEGLFEESLKRQLPANIKRIVLITSPTGAAVRDFITTCKRRRAPFTISVLPVRVQGARSSEEIVAALEKAAGLFPDVIALCRGGGSIEDLWSFNEEAVARAIHKVNIPVITGIGHETDFTIADFCADIRCATPTAAAEMLAPRAEMAISHIRSALHRIARVLTWKLASAQTGFDNAQRRLYSFGTSFYAKTLYLDTLHSRILNRCLQIVDRKNLDLNELISRIERESPIHRIKLLQYRISSGEKRLAFSIRQIVEAKQADFEMSAAVLDSVSPLATLSRGYSIVSRTDHRDGSRKVITASTDVQVSEKIDIRLYRGRLECIVSKRS